jgi:hypothetical protein
MIFSGDAHPALPPREYEIVPYKDKADGFQNHHGVLDAWAKHNIPGYVSRAPNSTTIRLSIEHHKETVRVLNAWMTQRGRPVDWTKVTPREILELSERAFDAANVPHDARVEYYRQFTQYLYEAK